MFSSVQQIFLKALPVCAAWKKKGMKHGLAEVGDVQYDQDLYSLNSSFRSRNLD